MVAPGIRRRVHCREESRAVLSDKMRDGLNEQMVAELYSAYLYLGMAAYFESVSMPGMANWMRAQFAEEQEHGFKFFDYVKDQGGRVRLTAIEAPPMEWASPLAAFEAAYQHEQKVTGLINGLVRLAEGEGDSATRDFLQWFVKEQEEEEESVDAIVQKLRKVKEAASELPVIDQELGQRRAG